jgi:hypothetical protein
MIRFLITLAIVLVSVATVYPQARTAERIQPSVFSSLDAGTPPLGSVRYCTNCLRQNGPCVAAGIGQTPVGADALKTPDGWQCSSRSGSGGGGGGLADPGSNGLIKRTGLNLTAPAVAGTDYLAPSGSGASLTGITFTQLVGFITDAQVPNNITVDLATTATTATTAEAGDSATAFFSAGTIEAARLPALSGLTGSVTDAQVPNTITVDLATLASTATTANAGDSATAFFSSGTIEVGRGGTGLGAPGNNQLIVGDGSAFVFTTLPSCSNATNDKLLYNSTTRVFTCGSDQTGAGGSGITTLNTLTSATQTFSKTDDTNVTLTLTPSGSDHNFALGWTGTLADARVADNITLTDITQITNRAVSNTTGDLAASRVDDGGVAATQALFSGAAGAAGFRAIADADIPNSITIDLATTATTATTANAGDSATAFFSAGTIEAARLPDLSGLNGAVTDAQVPNTITVDLATTATTANAGDSATAFFSSGTIEAARLGSGSGGSTKFLREDSTWQTIAAGGDVVGPSSATANAIARFDLTTGKLIKNSVITVADTTGDLVSPGTATFGSGSAEAGGVFLGQGTAQSTVASNIGLTAPTSVTAYNIVYPSAAASGIPHFSNSSNIVTMTISGIAIADLTATGTPSASTFLRGDNTWATPAGSGTVTATAGALTSNALVLGAGTTDTKVAAGLTTDGVSYIRLGEAGTSAGGALFRNQTSGDITIAPPATGALGTSVLTLPIRTATIATTTGTLTSGRCAEFDASGNLVQAAAGCAAGSGTVSVVGAGSLTSTALVTGGGTTLVQTPSATATLDASGNVSTPGTITTTASSTGILGLKDTDASHYLNITPGSNLTANRVFTITTGDAARTLNMGGNITTAADFITSGANALTLTTTGSTNVTLPTSGTLAVSVANGTSALGTSAISSGTCATAVTTTATGTATTDVVLWGFNGDPTGVTGYAPTTNGMLTIIAYPSANNVNFKVCNNTSASVTPGAITLNWRVAR